MPPTVSVAAFVFGVVLILAALIGKDLKMVTMELPALGPGRRLVLGLLGIGLTAFGLMEGQLPDFKLPSQSATTPGATQLVSAAPPPVAAAAQIRRVLVLEVALGLSIPCAIAGLGRA